MGISLKFETGLLEPTSTPTATNLATYAWWLSTFLEEIFETLVHIRLPLKSPSLMMRESSVSPSSTAIFCRWSASRICMKPPCQHWQIKVVRVRLESSEISHYRVRVGLPLTGCELRCPSAEGALSNLAWWLFAIRPLWEREVNDRVISVLGIDRWVM